MPCRRRKALEEARREGRRVSRGEGSFDPTALRAELRDRRRERFRRRGDHSFEIIKGGWVTDTCRTTYIRKNDPPAFDDRLQKSGKGSKSDLRDGWPSFQVSEPCEGGKSFPFGLAGPLPEGGEPYRV